MMLLFITTMADNHDDRDRDRLFHMDSRRIQSQDYDQSPPYRWTILQALDGITSSYFGILITVLVVALVHFRGRLPFLARLCFQSYLCFFFFFSSSFPHKRWHCPSTLAAPALEWLQSYRDRARGKTVWEILQRIAAWFPSPVPEQGVHKTARNARRNRHRRQTSIPELEMTVTNEKVSSCYQRELEPAFQDEAEYPEGWLVYHPILGVVKKTEAEHFKIFDGKGGVVPELSEGGKPPCDGKHEDTPFESSNTNEGHQNNVEREKRSSNGENQHTGTKWDELKAMERSEDLPGDDESNVLVSNGVVNLLKETALTAS
jgi:hypothetical protein